MNIILLLIVMFFYSTLALSAPMETQKNIMNRPSDDVKYVAGEAVRTGDNKSKPFVILDKKNARIYVYDYKGSLLGDAPVLLGLAVGDELPSEIARLPLSQINPTNRITAAGRYLAETGIDKHGKEVLWVDFQNNLAIHPVIDVPNQHRPERLQSETIEDNRISWGCINVPKLFYKNIIGKNFATNKGIVYILPEVKSLKDYSWFNKN
jgi:hypothetical protein